MNRKRATDMRYAIVKLCMKIVSAWIRKEVPDTEIHIYSQGYYFTEKNETEIQKSRELFQNLSKHIQMNTLRE